MVGDPAVPLPDAGFEVVRKGYDQSQVEAHLRRLDADVRILTTDRDAALDQAEQLNRELDDSRARADRLRAQVRTLVSPQQSVQGMSERMRSMLRLAEDEVAEMLVRAETEVNKRVREAEQKANQILADARNEVETVQLAVRVDAETTEKERAALRAELEADRLASTQTIADADAAAEHERTRLRAAHDAELRTGTEALAASNAEAEQARALAWSDSEARRALVEEDFTIAMDRRRTDALTALTAELEATRRNTEELRTSTAAESRTVVAEAQDRARQIVADAEHDVVELIALRTRIVEQLGGMGTELQRTIGGLSPLAGESLVQASASPASAPTLHPDAVSEQPAVTLEAATGAPVSGDAASADKVTADAASADKVTADAASADKVTEDTASGDAGTSESTAEDTVAEDTPAEGIANRAASNGTSADGGTETAARRPSPRRRTRPRTASARR